ncbi:MAG: hypothetical protein GF329_16085 [Candidatus Lokiarchaeota archaeon]|nr:hypothetical protein [Candidatus Lokiarchaeota archaeon]
MSRTDELYRKLNSDKRSLNKLESDPKRFLSKYNIEIDEKQAAEIKQQIENQGNQRNPKFIKEIIYLIDPTFKER